MADLREIQIRIAGLLESMGGRVAAGAAGGAKAAALAVEIDGRQISVVIYDSTEVSLPPQPTEPTAEPTAKPTPTAGDPAGGVPQQDMVYDVSQFGRTAEPPKKV